MTTPELRAQSLCSFPVPLLTQPSTLSELLRPWLSLQRHLLLEWPNLRPRRPKLARLLPLRRRLHRNRTNLLPPAVLDLRQLRRQSLLQLPVHRHVLFQHRGLHARRIRLQRQLRGMHVRPGGRRQRRGWGTGFHGGGRRDDDDQR